ncbi:MAG: cytochrome c biogenesis protein CcsA [Gammaproteobacteria bacterium]|nr:cytochrome c biogenesis protein CcsA [Gammaproteobacteria bacterium]
MLTFVSALSILCYLLSSVILLRRLRPDLAAAPGKSIVLLCTFVALLLHAWALYATVVTEAGLNLGFTNISSVAVWFVASLLLIAMMNKPIEALGIIIFPVTAIVLSIHTTVPTTHIVLNEARGLSIHILFSILAYSLLGLACVQAILLSTQERNLHNRHPGGFIRALPALETMETLLFQMISIGFALQTMSLASGFVYLEDMFAQHIVHKTVLSVVAWLVFATLLWGRWKHGWRGRTAVRWTISGFVTLMVAYFGSKYVLEILLKR